MDVDRLTFAKLNTRDSKNDFSDWIRETEDYLRISLVEQAQPDY